MSKLVDKHISTKGSFKINIRKDMFALAFVDLENQTNNYIWEFEKMNLLK